MVITLYWDFKMYKLQASWFVFAFAWNFANCQSECEFVNLDFKSVVAGIEGKVESSDPLRKSIINEDLDTLKYSLTNVTLTGMKDCEVIQMQCDQNSKNELTFQYNIQCPHILVTYDYEASGKLAYLIIKGHGTGSVNPEDYVIMFNGIYETVVGRDKKPRPVIKKYTMDTEPRGIVKFSIKNLYHGDQEKEAFTNKFFNDNWREMEKLLRSPTIDSFMELFIKNLNAYSKAK